MHVRLPNGCPVWILPDQLRKRAPQAMTRLHVLMALNLGGLVLTLAAPQAVLPYLFAVFTVDAALQMCE